MAKFGKSSIISPLIIITFYIVFILVLRSFLPTGKALIDSLSSIYGRFGYEIVIIGSLLEGLILINLFTPGVIAVGLGVVFAKAGELDLTLTIILAVTGALVGFMLDFILGRFGFAEVFEKMGYGEVIRQTKSKLERFSLKTFSLGFIHPNLGALISLSAGTLKMDFKKFFVLAFLSTMIWYIVWGLLIYALGEVFLTILTRYVWLLLLLAFSIWMLMSIYGNNKIRSTKSEARNKFRY